MTTFFQRATMMIGDVTHSNSVPARLAPLLRSSGIANVSLKALEGSARENVGYLDDAATAWAGKGFGVSLWGQHHGDDPASEVAIVSAAKRRLPFLAAYFAATEEPFKYGGPFPAIDPAVVSERFAKSEKIFGPLAVVFPDAMGALPLGEPDAAWPTAVWRKYKVRVSPEMYGGDAATPYDATAKSKTVAGFVRQGVDSRYLHPTYRATDPHPARVIYRSTRVRGLLIFDAEIADDASILAWGAELGASYL